MVDQKKCINKNYQKNKIVKVCNLCLSKLDKGLTHKCLKKTRLRNLQNLIGRESTEIQENLAGCIIKSKISKEKQKNHSKGTSLISYGRSSLPIIMPNRTYIIVE